MRMSLKFDWLAPMSARVTGSIVRLNSALLATRSISSVGARISLMLSFETNGAKCRITHGIGLLGSLTWLLSGILSTRAASAGTARSILKSYSSHRSFSRSACNFHSLRSIGSSRIQYTCAPRPDWRMVGRGSLTSLQNFFSAARPSAISA